MKRAKKAVVGPKQPFREVIETFSKPSWSYVQQEPSSFNGIVSIRKYRITIEEIEEPKEVLAERLLELWRKCDNHHERWPLNLAAKDIGVELPSDEFGINRSGRYEGLRSP